MALAQVDQDMWKAYGVKLANTYLNGGKLPDNQRFYLAPLSQAGIAASASGLIPTPITNQGVFNVANSLMSLETPCFIPTADSYFGRCKILVDSIYLDAKGDGGLQAKYAMAQKRAAAAQAKFNETKKKAYAQWKDEVANGMTNMDFAAWAAQNYPEYGVDQKANSAAAAEVSQISTKISGPGAAEVAKYITILGNVDSGTQGVMPCSTASASWISDEASGAKQDAPPNNLLAAYDIQNTYAAEVDNWINTYDQGPPRTIVFTQADFASSSWSELGFSNSSVNISGSAFWFFTVTYTENNQRVEKKLSVSEAGDSFKATLTFSGLESFYVNPSAVWNPSSLLGFEVVDNAPDSLLEPKAMINTIIVGYGCGMSIEMSSQCSDQIQGYLSKASSSGGSASLFGYNIGLAGDYQSSNTSTTTFDNVLNGSSGTSITIPPSNNGYPTLLAAVGTALPVPKKHKKNF